MFAVLIFFAALLISSSAAAQTEPLRFTILHTNDEHSTLLPVPLVDYHPGKDNPTRGGFARLATLVNQIRAEKQPNGEPVLLFSGGDIMGGSPFAWIILDESAPEIKLMQHIGYDAMVVGNHEFDYGPEIFASYLKRAGYPENHDKMSVISSNIQIPDGHPLHEAEIQRYKIFELDNGLKIGVFGLLGKEAISVAPLAEPVTFSEQHYTARRYVSELRQQGADIIMAITHSGVDEDIALAQDVNGIDMIIGGHDHTALHEPVIANNTIIVQSGYYLQYLGMAELEFDLESRSLSLLNEANNNPYLMPVDSSVPEDVSTSEMIAEYTEKLNRFVSNLTDGEFDDVTAHLAKIDRELRHAPPLKETQVGNIVTDAMRLEAEKITGKKVDIAIQGNGVIRDHVTPGTMEWSGGAVSFLNIATIAGLGSGPDQQTPGYPMVSVYLTGKEVYRALEVTAFLSQYLGNIFFFQVSGMRFEYDPGRSILLRIPFTDTPVPTYRSVFKAELYEGEGKQTEDGPWKEIRKDDTLYHIVTDYYVASFLPMVGELLPRLQIVLKNEHGQPVSHTDETVIYHNDREYKVWQTLTGYISSFDTENGIAVIPDYYQETGNRIIEKRGFPLIVWPLLGLFALIGLIFLIVRWIKKR